MSDDLGTDAGTGEPNAPEVDGAGAPIVREKPAPAPAEAKASETKPPPKPRTSDDDFEDLLKKSGGLKYKAGGKEKAITSTADLKRLLSRVDGTESAASEALKARQEADSVKARVSALAKMRPAERIQALAGMGIDPKAIREAFEEEILADDERAKSQLHLTPREREYEAKLREQDSELASIREEREAARKEQEEAAYAERVTQTGERLTKATVGALQKAKITGEHAPHFLNAIAQRLDRNERLGLELDEDELADIVVKEHETLADQYYGGLDVPALADKLGGMVIADPEDPTKQTTRLKLLMKECARRIRATVNGTSAPLVSRPTAPTVNGKTPTKSELMDAARTFGGGVTY